MRAWVIDTNVLLAANGAHEDIGGQCVEACVARLEDIRSNGMVVIDDQYRILLEYLGGLDSRNGKGPGDVFLKWLLVNQANSARCSQVRLTETAPDVFNEFPSRSLEDMFDPSDRKFVAVAAGHPGKPPILQATDSKWLNWREDLREAGITVEFLCPDDLRRFYVGKFPDRPVPAV